MTKARLLKLEKAAKAVADRPCTLCYGEPWAAVIEEWASDPKGLGCRRTGRRWITKDDARRVSVDLRCRKCGAIATDIVILQKTRRCGPGPAEGDMLLPAAWSPPHAVCGEQWG